MLLYPVVAERCLYSQGGQPGQVCKGLLSQLADAVVPQRPAE